MDDNFSVLLGKRFKELRKNKGFTQDKFSEMPGIDAKHLSRIECGKTQPSLNLIKHAASIFNIEISKFFEIEHLYCKDELISQINEILKNTKEDKVSLIYKIIKSIEG